MSAFAKRRRVGLALLVAAFAAAWAAHALVSASLRDTAHASGWLLLALVLALGFFNARKRLPFLRLGSASTWMQLHAYAGIFAGVVFLDHVDFRLPSGAFDGLLAGLFVAVTASGVVGLFITRLLPPRLAARGEAILFERIPALRASLQAEVEGLVLDSARESQTTTLARFYEETLANFFHGPRNLVHHWIDSTTRFRRLEQELFALERYTNAPEREILREVHQRMCLKEDLDYRWAQYVALKGWLFAHVPLTYGLLIAVAFHVALVLAFDGGLS